MRAQDIRTVVSPTITPDQLLSFYERNDICEKGYGRELAAKPLRGSDLVVAAFRDDRLVGIARALFDGLSADIVEFCLDLEAQGGESEFRNGSLIENDAFGVGRRLGEAMIRELLAMGADFISVCVLAGVEEDFYRALGFKLNEGSLEYIIDQRPYVTEDRSPDHSV
jgi:hypothetical protein